jgi:hypothetical protein
MFLELHIFENDEKIMLNINRIQSIYQEKAATYIYIGEVAYRVKESYEDVIKCINEHYNR